MNIAVDFDGTIVEHKYPKIGKEIRHAVSTLRRLSDEGHNIILWTHREGKLLDDAVNFCRERGLEFYAVNTEYPGSAWTGHGVSRKLKADIYIDDRNVGGLPEWTEIYSMITGDELHESSRGKGFFGRLHERCMEARGKY